MGYIKNKGEGLGIVIDEMRLKRCFAFLEPSSDLLDLMISTAEPGKGLVHIGWTFIDFDEIPKVLLRDADSCKNALQSRETIRGRPSFEKHAIPSVIIGRWQSFIKHKRHHHRRLRNPFKGQEPQDLLYL